MTTENTGIEILSTEDRSSYEVLLKSIVDKLKSASPSEKVELEEMKKNVESKLENSKGSSDKFKDFTDSPKEEIKLKSPSSILSSIKSLFISPSKSN